MGTVKSKRSKLLVLKLKRGALFVFGLSFFFFPGQNWYLSAQSTSQSPEVQGLEVSIAGPADYPVNFTGKQPPYLTAQSAVIMDRDSAVLIYGKNEKVKLLPASTVKLMTALVVLDHYDLDDVLVVEGVSGQGQEMGLVRGEKIKVENLLYGLLVSSANDAAYALAQNYPGGERGFMAAMNEKAKNLSLKDTHFANPTGLDSDEKGNALGDYSYTTALDLARLASWALKNQTLAKMVAAERIVVSDVSGKIKHPLFNLNQLLESLAGVRGIKTGWTEKAGECLTGYAERGGRGIITVVLGSEDRFGETTRIVEWVFDNYRWENLTPSIQS